MMIIQIRYDNMYYYDIQRCHFSCLASLKASICSVSLVFMVVVVALIVDWGGLSVCCDFY